MRIKLIRILFLGFLGMITISGCSKSSKSVSNGSHPKDLFRIDVGSEAPSLDPTLAEDNSSTRIMYDLFAGLVDFDQSNKIIPGMASSWDISPDAKTYTFHLRPNLKFSDGSPITANNFVYSWRRLIDPKVASPYNFLLSRLVNAREIMDGKQNPDNLGVYAPDSLTLVAKLNQPDDAFLNEIAMPNTMVVSQKNIEKFGSAWTKPQNMITSGAYKLKEHVVNGYILAEKNPNFWDAANVSIKEVKYLPYDDKNASIPAYRSGGLDMTFQSVPADQFSQLRKDYPEELHLFRQEAIYYYDFSWNNPELAKNAKLRQALSMAIDRKVLTNDVLKMGQVPLYSTATDTVEGGKYKGLDYEWGSWSRDKQIAEAKKLYAEAGYSATNPYTVSISYNTNDLHKKTALAVAAMWKSVLGVNVNLQNQEWKTFIQTRHKGGYQIARDGWIADYNSVTSYTNLYECKNDQNNSHYCNSKYDKLIEQAKADTNQDHKVDFYREALRIPLNDYAVIPLFQYTIQVLVKPYVTGFDSNTNSLYHVQSKWMSLK